MIKNLYKIGNAVDDLYTKIAGVPYPVSAAVGSKPTPTPTEDLVVDNVVFHYDLVEEYKQNWSLTADIQVNNIPEGWYGSLCFEDGEEQYTGNVFTATDLVDGTLTITDLMPNYDPISPVYVALLSNETDANNYYFDSEEPYVPTEGEIYAEVSANSTNVQNNL